MTAIITGISHTITDSEGPHITTYCGDFTEKSGLQTFNINLTSPLISYTMHVHFANAVFFCCR